MIHVLTHSFPTRPSSVLVIYETDVVARIGARVETDRRSRPIDRAFALDLVIERARAIAQADHERAARLAPDDIGIGLALLLEDILDRSEEHTSELQSLMRISYAVFCLNTTKQQHKQSSTTIIYQS